MLYSVSRSIFALILKLLCRIEAKGKENIPKKSSFILVSNHVSCIDPAAVGVACPRRLDFMARHDLFSNPFSSWWSSGVGVIPVKRDSADLSALKEAMKRIKEGRALALFPEGTRQVKGVSEPAKPEPGIGFLVAKLNVPVIPAFIKGTDDVLPKGAKFIRPKKICVTFGKEIHIERGMPYEDIAQLVMEHIRHLAC